MGRRRRGQRPLDLDCEPADHLDRRTAPTRATCSTRGNYINWLKNGSTITQTRLQIVQQVAIQTINSARGRRRGQCRPDAVQQQHEQWLRQHRHRGRRHGAAARSGPVAANRGEPASADIAAMNADGCTPLSETLYEAYLYLSGNNVSYGLTSHKLPGAAGLFPSVMSSRMPAPNTGQVPEPAHDLLPAQFHRVPDRRSADRGQQRQRPDPDADRRQLQRHGRREMPGRPRALHVHERHPAEPDQQPDRDDLHDRLRPQEVNASASCPAEHRLRRRRRVLRGEGHGDAQHGADEHHARHPGVQYVVHRARGVGQRVQPHAEPERPLRHGVPPERDLQLGRQHQEVPPGSDGRHRWTSMTSRPSR